MSEYHWLCVGADQEPVGWAPVGTRLPTFPTQGDAEAWLAESWADLADHGVDEVSLMHFEDMVYGPMSLEPPA
ncbi:hypothetical protein [Nostocoides jenkinsii]|uniref:Uncharacterized protein n=1 Tax=Nostocoides jenkinsii Ben 74 TaxID=1193518 RepID=A0A077M9I6_9MICO|nr:hypothetical protein [Tetrasphaera jenkinsii]CCI51442.1 conserved hypothetical protein [Tetrasphaera jenkinsii Ben 74]